MALQIPELLLPGQFSDVLYYTVGLVVAVLALSPIWKSWGNSKFDSIPTVGSSTWLGSWWAGITYVFNGHEVFREGYEKYKGRPFKVATFYQWIIVVSGRQHVEEFNKARPEDLSFLLGANETVRAEHTIGYDVFFNPWHIRILRMGLNRNLPAVYPDLKDEVFAAFTEALDLKGHEWKTVPALETSLHLISRASNRVFVGLPLCRDPRWVKLNIEFTIDVAKGGLLVSLVPRFMAPLVVRLLTKVHSHTKLAIKLLTPVVEERLKQVKENGGSWAGGSNDLLSWLLQGAEDHQRNAATMAERILSVNFAAIHTSSNALTQSFYNLASHPEYVPALREEVERIVGEEGWTKASVAKMHKVDSFIKESQRMNGIVLGNMVRVAMKDYPFSDGTIIPKGSYVMMATQSMHFDEEYYENPHTFEPFRFAEMRRDEDVSTTKHGFATTTPEYLPFGHGRHSCPGRWFAADELATVFAHAVVSYDVKLEDNGMRPRNLSVGSYNSANPTARLMFRKRV